MEWNIHNGMKTSCFLTHFNIPTILYLRFFRIVLSYFLACNVKLTEQSINSLNFSRNFNSQRSPNAAYKSCHMETEKYSLNLKLHVVCIQKIKNNLNDETHVTNFMAKISLCRSTSCTLTY